MAETVVLASLTVDSSGVVTGMGHVNAAVGGTQAKIASLGVAAQGFVGKMTNMNGALNAVARSLGLVSLGLVAAQGIRTLTTDLWNSVPALKSFSSGLEDAYNWLVKNEAAGAKLNLSLSERAKRLAALVGLGARGVNVGPLAAGLREADLQASDSPDVLKGAYVRQPDMMTRADMPKGIGDVERYAAANRELARSFEDIAAVGPFQDMTPPEWIGDAAYDLERLVNFGQEVKAAFEPLPGVFESAFSSLSGHMSDFVDQMDPAIAKFDLFMTGLQALGQGIADAFLESGVTARQAAVELLKTIARMAITYALMFTAAGIVASTGLGAAVVGGTPAQFFKAAAIFAAVGVVAGVAAKAVEGGGGRERSASGGGGGEVSSRREQVVNVNVQGSLMGSDPNELARSLQRLLMTAQEDGA